MCKPKDFAQQINLNMDNCWGIVRALVDLALKLDDGKYLLVKDPNKPLLRLYSVPDDAFQVRGSCPPKRLQPGAPGHCPAACRSHNAWLWALTCSMQVPCSLKAFSSEYAVCPWGCMPCAYPP